MNGSVDKQSFPFKDTYNITEVLDLSTLDITKKETITVISLPSVELIKNANKDNREEFIYKMFL
jgi:hypothetical protein